MTQTKRHKVFISFHEKDQRYKDEFARMLKGDIVDKSVKDKDIDDTDIKVDTIRQKIRDNFIADATVTVVLIGPCTWQRKHVDWEIGSSLRDTEHNSRCGLVGILLPNHPNFHGQTLNPSLMPPRLAYNITGQDPYARIYKWPSPQKEHNVRDWIHKAFIRREGTPPNNKSEQFRRNRSGECSRGW